MAARFIGEPITVEFDTPPVFSKRPPCPARLVWRQQVLEVTTLLRAWHDYRRRGRMAQNMRPGHAARAARLGSWGVGRFYFQVRVQDGRCFELYYDRAPRDADDRGGGWFLLQDLSAPADG